MKTFYSGSKQDILEKLTMLREYYFVNIKYGILKQCQMLLQQKAKKALSLLTQALR